MTLPTPLAPASSSPPVGAPASPTDPSAGGADEALAAARAFEKLLIHDMLKSMRQSAAALGETPSSGEAMYHDMLDERLAGAMSEAGGLGLATVLAADLRARGASDAAGARHAMAGEPDADVDRGALTTVEILRLRDLVRPGDASSSGAAASGIDGLPRALLPSPGAAARGPGGAAAPAETRPGAFAALAPSGAFALRPTATGGETDEQRAFIAPLLPHARASAERLGTSPDAVLAIAALESGWGRHVPRAADGRSSHNLFGIKARANEPDAGLHRTAEYLDGSRVTTLARFRAFASPAAAVSGFADFVLDNPRYAAALERADDPPEFLRRLQAAGYATDPRYADKAIALMQRIGALRESLS